MSSILWLNIGLAVPFVLAFIGFPLWLTLRHADTAPDHAKARAPEASGGSSVRPAIGRVG